MMTPLSFPTEKMSQSVHRSCLNFSCVKHGPYQNFQFIPREMYYLITRAEVDGYVTTLRNILYSRWSGEGGGVHMEGL